jgi:ceramide glucosyltransferase
MTLEIVVFTLVALSVAALIVTLGSLGVTVAGRRKGEPALRRFPRVSICKPLAGTDDDLEANLASFAAIDYPSYEVLLGVASRGDPAYPVAMEFVAAHPWVDARVIVTDPGAATNPKVAQLVGLEEVATGEVIVISDSNVRVGTRYLSGLVADLERPGVGLVTSLVAGGGERSVGAAVENLALAASVAPVIATSDVVVGRVLCIGKSMAMWRGALDRLGGFRAFGSVLGEDHALGCAFARAGYRVALSADAVENRNVDCSLGRTFERHSRWMKMRRSVAPWAFAIEPCVSPVLVSTLAAAIVPSPIAFGVLGACTALHVGGAFVAVRILRGTWPAAWTAPIEVVRPFFLFACWLRAWASRRVSWRGHPYRLHRGMVITPARPRFARLRAAFARAA